MLAGLLGMLGVALGVPAVGGLLGLARPNLAIVTVSAAMLLAVAGWLTLLPAIARGLQREPRDEKRPTSRARNHVRN